MLNSQEGEKYTVNKQFTFEQQEKIQTCYKPASTHSRNTHLFIEQRQIYLLYEFNKNRTSEDKYEMDLPNILMSY